MSVRKSHINKSNHTENVVDVDAMEIDEDEVNVDDVEVGDINAVDADEVDAEVGDTVIVDADEIEADVNEAANQEDLVDSIFNLSSQLKSQKIKEKNFSSKKDYSNVVDDILGERNFAGKKQYLIKFLDDSDNPSGVWTPADDVSEYVVETFKHVHVHNNQVNQLSKTDGQPIDSKHAYVYTRTSNDNDISIETQRIQCFDFCSKNLIRIKNYSYDCGVSGGLNKRRNKMNNLNYELGYLLDTIKANSLLVVYSIDRLGRNVAGVSELFQKLLKIQCTIVFVKEQIILDNNTGSHIRKIIMQQVIDSEHLSHLTAEKVRNTRERLKREGHFLGKAAYGTRVIRNEQGIRKLVVNKPEAMILKSIKSLHKSFIFSPDKYNLIATKLNNRRIKYRNGKSFNRQNIRYLIKKYNL